MVVIAASDSLQLCFSLKMLGTLQRHPATMRNLEKKGQLEEEGKEYLGDTLVIKQMDVCSDESVEKAVK